MRIGYVVALMVGVTAAGLAALPAYAQMPPVGPGQPVDSTQVLPRYRFSPVYNNRITADVSSVGMANDFRTGLITPWGSLFDFSLMADEKHYRLQNRREENKRMRAADLHTFSQFLRGTASYMDSRVFNRSVAVGGGVQDFVINDQSVDLGANYRRGYGNFRMDLNGAADAINGERTFKTDRTLAAGVNGGVGYNLTDRIVLQGRGALRGTRDRSETVDSLFTGLRSSEDSLMAGVQISATDSISFDVSHRVYNGDRIFADQGRGALGGQTGGAENVFEETEKRDARSTTLSLDSQIFHRLNVKVSASHDEQVFDYAVQTTRYSKTVGDGVSGTITYRTPWRTQSTVQFENTETLRDLGPQSVSSLTDKRRRVALALTHAFSKTFSMNLNASSQIQQSFYLRYDDNPRDRDQVDTNLNLSLSSRPFKKVTATITLAYSATEFVNIDATQSENNRTRELWELRPAFTYTFNDRLSIVQNYGLAFDYTDFLYRSTDNFLDRNITFSNEFQYRPTKAIDLRFEYALHLHDTGSYLPDPETGERVLDVTGEDRRDRTRIHMDYRLTKRVRFFAEHLYSRREDRTPGSDDVSKSTDGSIQLGTAGDYDWGVGRRLRFQVTRVKRFSPFGSDEEKNYWDARSEFAYPF